MGGMNVRPVFACIDALIDNVAADGVQMGKIGHVSDLIALRKAARVP